MRALKEPAHSVVPFVCLRTDPSAHLRRKRIIAGQNEIHLTIRFDDGGGVEFVTIPKVLNDWQILEAVDNREGGDWAVAHFVFRPLECASVFWLAAQK